MGPHPLLRSAAVLAVLGAVVLVGASPATASRSRAEILVGFQPGVSPATQRVLLTDLGAVPEERFARIRTYVASVSAATRAWTLAQLEDDPRVRYAEPNVRFRVNATPDDPAFGELWGLDNVGQTVGGRPGTCRREAPT